MDGFIVNKEENKTNTANLKDMAINTGINLALLPADSLRVLEGRLLSGEILRYRFDGGKFCYPESGLKLWVGIRGDM